MADCISEDELLDLAHGRRALGDAPALEAHLAACRTCSALLGALVAAAPPARALIGRTLGPYRLDGLIGAGAMGEVYRGWDLRLHRHVAVKVLPARFAASADRVERLAAEGRAAAAIAHPNVVTVYDVGADDGVAFVVSELIAGESLRSLIDRGPIARATALALALQLVRGLAAAHARGVVHRDLKPSNLIVTDDGTLKIIDLGLAKLRGGDDAAEAGAVLGTPGYLAPEQARGEPADARSDLFAAGAIFHELLTGRRAFGGATYAEQLSAVLRDPAPPIDDPAAPIVARCLEKDPRRRFQSADDLAWVLDGLRDPRPAAAPRPAAISRRSFLAGAAAAGAGGVVLGRWLAPSAPARRDVVPAYRQLTFRQGRVASARFTRDGGSVVYAAAWEDSPSTLFTARLGGGGTRPLDLPPAQLLAVSSRGELALSLDHHFVEGFHQEGQLAVAPLEGGAPRGLGVDVQHADFTPDGADLAIVRHAAGRFRLELPIGRVLAEAGWLSHPRVSPDGALVACCMHDGPGDDRGVLAVVPRGGGDARVIGPGWSSLDGLAWAPDGRALWISASVGGGNNAVWSVALDGRRLAHIPAAGRLRVHDLGPGGTLAVTHVSGRLRMMVKAPGAPAEVDLSLSDVSLVADIAADGHAVVCTELGDVDTANGAYLRPTRGGPALRLADGMPLDLADDGRGVLVLLYRAEPTLAIVSVSEGAPRPLPVPAGVDVRWARWGAGERIVVGGAAPGRPPRVWRFDPGRAITPITDEGRFGAGAVSPDGRRVALIADDRLHVVDVDGGAASTVPGDFAGDAVCGWDAAGVLVRRRAPPIVVRAVEIATGVATPRLTIDPPPLGRRGVNALVVSAGGDAYAYSYGQELSRLYTMTTGA